METVALNFSPERIGQLKFSHNHWGQIVMTEPEGREVVGIEPVRCFPHTAPDVCIALLDAGGHEVLQLDSLSRLSSEARQFLEHELKTREFIPEIRRLIAVSAQWPPCEVTVETDRGETRFAVDSEDDFRKLPSGAVLVNDSHGVRYRISEPEKLDPSSRRLLRRFL